MKESGERASGRDAGPGRGKGFPEGTPFPETLSDLGISKKQSSLWQQLADVDEKSFAGRSTQELHPPGLLRAQPVARRAAVRRKSHIPVRRLLGTWEGLLSGCEGAVSRAQCEPHESKPTWSRQIGGRSLSTRKAPLFPLTD
jgi:hypothetical protein